MQPAAQDKKPSPKIFGIGFNKTGTTTLKRCYQKLDLTPVCPTQGIQIRRITHKVFNESDYEPLLAQAEKYRAFEDRPWNVWEAYRHLDERYPDSLFILTVRDPANWWRSIERWISVSKPWMARRYRNHLRAKNLLPATMIEAYLRYNQEVRDYFAGSGRLLEIDFEAGQGWPELCTFLDVPIPDERFPHINTQSYSADDNKRRGDRIRRKGRKKQKQSRVLFNKSNVQGKECRYCKQHASNLQRARQWLKALLGFLSTLRSRTRTVASAPVSAASSQTAHVLQTHAARESLGVVCCYINPLGIASIHQNFEKSYQSLLQSNASILVVEAVDEKNPISNLPASIPSLQVPIGSVWSRNHLVNCGISKLLAGDVSCIAWLDEGVTLDSPRSWAQSVTNALGKHSLVQAFEVASVTAGTAAEETRISAVKYFLEHGKFMGQAASPCEIEGEVFDAVGHGGYAWAARSEVLAKTALFEDLPFDTDSRMLFTAAYPIDDLWFKRQEKLTQYQYSPCKACLETYTACDLRWSYMTWAQHWSLAVCGEPGFVRENITVHQHKKDRTRHLMDTLIQFDYQPKEDVRSAQSGDWRFDPEDKRFLKAVRAASPLV